MTTFSNLWSGLKQNAMPAPYLLIDCAGIAGGEQGIPKQAFAELECLFAGDLADELADVSPYLGRLLSLSDEVAAVVKNLLDRQVALLVFLQDASQTETVVTFGQLHRHFRMFNVVYGPDGAPLFFRYYDPRVLRDVLGVLDEKQLISFFKLIGTMILLDRDGMIVQLSQQDGRLRLAS